MSNHHFWLQNSSLHVGLQHLPPRRRRRRLLAHRGPDVGTAGRRGARVEAKWREVTVEDQEMPRKNEENVGKMWWENVEKVGNMWGKC